MEGEKEKSEESTQIQALSLEKSELMQLVQKLQRDIKDLHLQCFVKDRVIRELIEENRNFMGVCVAYEAEIAMERDEKEKYKEEALRNKQDAKKDEFAIVFKASDCDNCETETLENCSVPETSKNLPIDEAAFDNGELIFTFGKKVKDKAFEYHKKMINRLKSRENRVTVSLGFNPVFPFSSSLTPSNNEEKN